MVTGPLLASLGASSLVVGVVTGAGETAALGLRLVSGPPADRTRRFWGLLIAGYAEAPGVQEVVLKPGGEGPCA
ncbi:hypothetical protein ABZ614_35220 [Streptomyces sp. NPDC013178]|uniref:hypothetical protein n=1 Tax=Streptomyces sp. NPDC013178 TaxID=3155118 RepID=UPI0033C00F43